MLSMTKKISERLGGLTPEQLARLDSLVDKFECAKAHNDELYKNGKRSIPRIEDERLAGARLSGYVLNIIMYRD